LIAIYRRGEKQSTLRSDQMTLLEIVARDGVTGLARALGDPTQVLAVLAALGLGMEASETDPHASTRGAVQ